MRHVKRALVALPRLIMAGLGALVLSGGLAPAVAGPIEDGNAAVVHADHAKDWAKVKDTADRWVLEAFVKLHGNTVYGEIAGDRLARIRTDANQPVLGPTGRTSPQTNLFLARADSTCRFALTFRDDDGGRTVRLWSMPNGEPIATVLLPFKIVSVAVSQDYLAIEGPRSIRLYDVKTGSFLRSIDEVDPGKPGTADLFFSEDGKELFSASTIRHAGVSLSRSGGRVFDLEVGIEFSGQTAASIVVQRSAAAECAVERQRIFTNVR